MASLSKTYNAEQALDILLNSENDFSDLSSDESSEEEVVDDILIDDEIFEDPESPSCIEKQPVSTSICCFLLFLGKGV